MTLYEKLSFIQQTMKAPKDKYNDFGKYKYRNAESILEAVKPFEAEYKVMLLLTDEAVEVGTRYYIKATARLYDLEDTSLCIEAVAYAREAEAQKGKDDSQITGTASSYARKYALNGLFLLDDTKDADTNEFRKEANQSKKSQAPNATPLLVDEAKVRSLKNELRRVGKTEEEALKYLGAATFEDVTVEAYTGIMREMEKAPSVNEELPFK